MMVTNDTEDTKYDWKIMQTYLKSENLDTQETMEDKTKLGYEINKRYLINKYYNEINDANSVFNKTTKLIEIFKTCLKNAYDGEGEVPTAPDNLANIICYKILPIDNIPELETSNNNQSGNPDPNDLIGG